MKHKKTITILVIIITILALFAAFIGVFSNDAGTNKEFVSMYGETIELYGKGLYKNDSIAVVAQGIAQDIVTVIMAVPLLLISLYQYLKDSFKGKLLLTGTLGYFLYTYISYVFLWMYNSLFLIYVVIMSLSFFAFLLCMMSFDIEKLTQRFKKYMPVKFLGGFQIFFGISIGLLWFGRIIPSLKTGTVPSGLDHYTTLVIQAMDLGFILPISILSGILLIKRRPYGYLLSSVIIMKGLTMSTALTAMVIGQWINGVKISFAEIAMFPIVNLIIIFCMFLILKNCNEEK